MRDLFIREAVLAHRLYAVKRPRSSRLLPDEFQRFAGMVQKTIGLGLNEPGAAGKMTFLGGHVFPTSNRSAALLIYQGSGGEIISFVIAPDSVFELQDMYAGTYEDVNFSLWTDRSYSMAVVGAPDKVDRTTFSRMLAQ